MKQSFWKGLLPHVLVIAVFFSLTLVYFLPAFQGKVLPQHDQIQAKGMAQELINYNKETGKDALWTNSMFSGMPSYQIRMGESPNIFLSIQRFLRFGMPYETAAILFWYLLGFYIFFASLGFKPWLSAIGALAFAFGSYNIIIIFAGHITKAYAMAFVPPVLAGFLLTYKGQYIKGALLAMLALGVQVSCGHYQITYYMAIMLLVYVVCRFIYDLKKKQLRGFFIASAFVAVAAGLATIPNLSLLWVTSEYGKYSTRGPSELADTKGIQTTGLDKDYILNDYSYGVGETFTLLIPNFRGGASGGALTEESNTYKLLRDNNYEGARDVIKSLPLYWGDQRYTAGPVYFGAIVCFLFVLGLFVVSGPVKWWLASAFTLSVMLAWGQNFMPLSELFLNVVPAYDKFRTVSMILVMANYAAIILGIFALKNMFSPDADKKLMKKKLLYSFYITGGITLLFGIASGIAGDFSSSFDSKYFPEQMVEAIRLDRQSLLRADSLRSFAFILLAAAGLWFALENKLKLVYLWAALGILFVLDGWTISRRYLNEDNFVSKQKFNQQIAPTTADLQIMQDTSDYRVLNLTVDPFNDATTSYFHKSVGGYHGAKLKRYQELIEHQISKNNMGVLDMLNAKYIISPTKNRGAVVQQNPNALGNAWYVNSVKTVATADEELNSLDNLNPAKEAVVNKKFADKLNNLATITDTLSKGAITLTSYAPDQLKYSTTTDKTRLAVFSEIYYPKGWTATIDGQKADILQVNYVLRGLVIPAGEHKVEFKFDPESFHKGKNVAMIGSILVLLALVGGAFWFWKKRNEGEDALVA